MLALVLSLQLLHPAPAQAALDLVPPLRLGLPGAAAAGAAPLELDDPYAGRLHLGELGAAALGVLLADVVTGFASGTAALIVGGAMTLAGERGFEPLLGALVAAWITAPLVNLALTPLAAVIGARMVDSGHPFAERRGMGAPLAATYAAKFVEALFFVGGAILLGLNVPLAELAMLPFLAVHFVGVPYAAAFTLHAQRQIPEPEPAPSLQPEVIPPPPPPPPQMGRRFVVPLIAASF